jgi:hypothetical protein
MYGGRSLGENNINALQRISVGENNLRAIEKLSEPKPPLQQPAQLAMPVQPRTQSRNFFARAKDFLKQGRYISKGAWIAGDITGYKPLYRLSEYAYQRGYGRKKKRKTRRVRRQRGRGIASNGAVVDRYGAYLPVPTNI